MAGEDEAELTVEADSHGETADDSQGTASDNDTKNAEVAELEAQLSDEEFDHAAESFIEVEQELQGVNDSIRGRGQAIEVEKVPAEEVPDEFPVEIDSENALALRLSMVEAEEETIVTYFEWPEEETGDRLAQLLELNDISPDRFANLHGKNILMTIEDGYYVPVLPDEKPRGDDRAIYGILAGLAPNFLILLAGLVGALGSVVSGPFFLLWVIMTFIVLPVSVYLDAWDLRTSADWDGGPLFWAFLAVIPVINVVAVPLYLLSRMNAEPLIFE